MFYACAYPEPPGCSTAALRPEGAGYEPGLHEFTLPYDKVRLAASPDAMLLDFFRAIRVLGCGRIQVAFDFCQRRPQ